MKVFSFTTILVLGGGACAAASAAASAMAAATADESTSVGMGALCLLFPGGSGPCAVRPSCHDSNQHAKQVDYLDATNLTSGAAAAAPSCGSPGSPLDGYLCSDLLRGSGGESVISIPPFVGALGRDFAQPFSFLGISIRCDSALRTSGARRRGRARLPLQ
eukprot:SAG31_NODE_13067_length_895_cov_1.008794_2_plen_160_part_01